MRRRSTYYGDDLAWIHDSGFGHVAQNGAAEILQRLRKVPKTRGNTRIVDLGCGSGILAEIVSRAGYDVVGFDYSPAMVAVARKRAPRAEFHCESFLTASLPRCIGVLAIGEVFNYASDRRNNQTAVFDVFARIHAALEPGGLFLFDVAVPGRAAESHGRKVYAEGPGWACLYYAEEERRSKTLKRTITTFRKTDGLYRRQQEVHQLKLYDGDDVARRLRLLGFQVRRLGKYGRFRFPAGWQAFLARKSRKIAQFSKTKEGVVRGFAAVEGRGSIE